MVTKMLLMLMPLMNGISVVPLTPFFRIEIGMPVTPVPMMMRYDIAGRR